MSRIIILSGIDGSGKSTNIKLISNYLKSLKFTFFYIWTRGGYTPIFLYMKSLARFIWGVKKLPSGNSEKRKKILKNNLISNLWVNIAIFDLILYWGFFLRFKMIFYDVIVCDRYLLDTFIDFEINFPNIKLNRNLLWFLLTKITPKPDLSLMLTIPFIESRKRLLSKKEPFPDDDKLALTRYKLYENYRYKYKYMVINTNLKMTLVTKKIKKEIKSLLSKD